jgi:AraC family transcriptional regulator
MSISDYQQTYIERIHQVVDYITEHISDEIVLDDLAAVACFSPFHFHRIFTSMIGKTPRDFIERLRLEKAANCLCRMPGLSVSEVAQECGYSSISTFSRSFKKYHKISPSQYLEKHVYDYHFPDSPLLQFDAPEFEADISDVEIVSLPAFHVAYVQILNGYASGIPKSWQKLLCYGNAHQLITPETLFIGMPFDNPGVTPWQKCRYRACITISSGIKMIKGEVKTSDIDAGRYAKYHFHGKPIQLFNVYAFLYGKWLPQSGYIPDEKPLIEIYPPELHANYTEGQYVDYDIMLPVRPL